MAPSMSPRKRARPQSSSPPSRKRTRSSIARSPPSQPYPIPSSVPHAQQSRKEKYKRKHPTSLQSSPPTRKCSHLEFKRSTSSSRPSTPSPVLEARRFLLSIGSASSACPATTGSKILATADSSTATNLLLLAALNHGNVLDYEDHEPEAESKTASDHQCSTEVAPPAPAPLSAPTISSAENLALDLHLFSPDSKDLSKSHDSDADSLSSCPSINSNDTFDDWPDYMPPEYWANFTPKDIFEEVDLWHESGCAGCVDPYAMPRSELWSTLQKTLQTRFSLEGAGGTTGFWQPDDFRNLISFRAKDGFYFADHEVTKCWRITVSDKKKVRMWLYDHMGLEDWEEMRLGWRYYDAEKRDVVRE